MGARWTVYLSVLTLEQRRLHVRQCGKTYAQNIMYCTLAPLGNPNTRPANTFLK